MLPWGMTYKPKTTPYDHQNKALQKARDRAAFAYFMEMGTGKTKVVIDEFGDLFTRNRTDAVMIIAPKGVYMNWSKRELPAHMPSDLPADVLTWNEGGKNYDRRLRAHLTAVPDRLRVMIMNTEAFSASKSAVQYAQNFLRSALAPYGAVDESTFIKTYDSNRTRQVVALGKLMKFRRIMTGSPVTRSPMDLYSQFQFLDESILGYRSFFAYRSRYAVLKDARFGGRTVKIIVGYRDVEDLSQKIAPHSFRVLKDDCLDLPPKVYVTREVEMTEEQKRVYGEVLRSATTQLGEKNQCPQCEGEGKVREGDDEYDCGLCEGEGFTRDGTHVTATEVIVQILRLHQILCGHATDEAGHVHPIPSNRVQTMLDVVAETSGKVIIWSRYRADIDTIVEALGKAYGDASVVQYHGGTPPAARETASRRFQEDETCRFIVSNAQTGGYGNTWTAASTVIYYSNDYDLEKRLQSEDRAHRSGQTKSVTYVDLICPGTVEEKILKALRAKIDISTAIMGDGYRSWLV